MGSIQAWAYTSWDDTGVSGTWDAKMSYASHPLYVGPFTGGDIYGNIVPTGSSMAAIVTYSVPPPDLVAPANNRVELGVVLDTVDSFVVTSEENGGGTVITSFTLDASGTHLDAPQAGGFQMPGLAFFWINSTNFDDRGQWFEASGAFHYIKRYRLITTTSTPTTTGPTTTIPTNVPPTVVERIIREKANPGYTLDLTFTERYDLLGVKLGDRVNLTISELGIIGRGHVVTKIKHHFQGLLASTSVPGMVLTSTMRLEKIPGTILPGAGTSTPSQDDAGTGAEISAVLRFDDPNSGFERGAFAP